MSQIFFRKRYLILVHLDPYSTIHSITQGKNMTAIIFVNTLVTTNCTVGECGAMMLAKRTNKYSHTIKNS